jgi:hypothetical protein
MNGRSNLVNGSGMRTLLLRRAGIVMLVLCTLGLIWWVSSDEPNQTGRSEGAVANSAPVHDTSRGSGQTGGGSDGPSIATAHTEDGFNFPFLGKVKSQMRVQEVPIPAQGGGTLDLPFRVYSDEHGHFRRAEFSREGTDELELPVVRIERAMQATEEKVLGFPSASAPVSWQTVLVAITRKVPMTEVKRMNLTYVNYQVMDRPPEPVFIVNVYGFDAMPPPAYSSKRDPKWKRTRFICDATGEVLVMDDCL